MTDDGLTVKAQLFACVGLSKTDDIHRGTAASNQKYSPPRTSYLVIRTCFYAHIRNNLLVSYVARPPQFRNMEGTASSTIENRIFMIRDQQVMLDRDLAALYEVTTKSLNQTYKRNKERFPESFAFTLTEFEYSALRSQIVTLEHKTSIGKGTHSKYIPTVYTELGVAMLSAVLKSEKAIAVSIEIMEVFVMLRRSIHAGNLMLERMDSLEKRMVGYDLKFDEINRFMTHHELPKHGIFFENQIFDAYAFFSDIVARAKHSIILIDNYIDHTVLLQLAKRQKNVTATIYTERIPAALQLDLAKHNVQYPPITIHRIKQVHDRFLLIDGHELYHIGASIKDLGKRWFAFSRMDSLAGEVMGRLGTNGE